MSSLPVAWCVRSGCATGSVCTWAFRPKRRGREKLPPPEGLSHRHKDRLHVTVVTGVLRTLLFGRVELVPVELELNRGSGVAGNAIRRQPVVRLQRRVHLKAAADYLFYLTKL